MKKAILILLLLPIIASAQSFNVFDIDTSKYPIMKAKFYSIDENGDQILNHTTSDFEITENGNPAEVLSVSCPEALPIPISVGIIVDTHHEINLARHGSERFVNFLKMPQNEIGFTYMDGRPLLFQDFTKDIQKARNSSKQIPPAPGGTSVSEMFFDEYAGGIELIKNREAQNRVLIFVSDLHCPNLSVDEQELIRQANDNNIRIYTVLLGTTDYTGLFTRIADNTNGVVFENVLESIEIGNVFKDILFREQNESCRISWNSNLTCEYSIDLMFNNENTNLDSKSIINLNDSQYLYFEYSHYFIDFGKNSTDTTIIITANNDTQTINDIIFEPDNGDYQIVTPLPILIPSSSSIELELQFTPISDELEYTRMELIGDYCRNSIGLLKGDNSKEFAKKTLNLIHPNGGEVFVAGSDTIISWEGISENENVLLEFSSDEGKSWDIIEKVATDNLFHWEIPKVSSNNCLVSISQFNSKNGSAAIDILIDDSFEYGGKEMNVFEERDYLYSFSETIDGGFIAVGSSRSNLDTNVNQGLADAAIIKLNSLFELEWVKTVSSEYGEYSEVFRSVKEDNKGNFIAVGEGKAEGTGFDFWVVKFDPSGNIIWSNMYGGKRQDEAFAVEIASDGNYIVAGEAASSDGHITEADRDYEGWIIKLNEHGDILWEKSYYTKRIVDIKKTYDDGYIVCGYGAILENISNTRADYWVMKIDSNGNEEWSNFYGGTEDDYSRCIKQTKDGGFVVAGISESIDGDVKKKYENEDAWIIKLDKDGNIVWSNTFGGDLTDDIYSITESQGGEIIFGGYTASNNGDISGDGNCDFINRKGWIIILDIGGNLVRSELFSGCGSDYLYDINLVRNKVVACGSSSSTGGDLNKELKNAEDFWMFSFALPPPPLQSDTSDAVFSIIMPEPVIQNNDIDMGEMIVGNTKDTIVSSVICNRGDAPLHVLGVDITGGDAADFLIPRGAGDFYLEKDQCQEMMFEFTPSQLDNRTAVATIRTTIGDFTDTINIRGVGIDPLIEATSKVVDFGKVRLGFSKDTTVFLLENKTNRDIQITNTSLIGPDLQQFEILTSDKSFTVTANNTESIELEYTAQLLGKANSTIQFEYKGAIRPLTSLLFAQGVDDLVQVYTDTIDFSKVELGSFKDTNAYIIRNISSSDILVSDLTLKGADLEQFSIEESNTEFEIESYDSLGINLRFTASKPGLSYTSIESKNHLTSTTLTTVLIGRGVGGKANPTFKDSFIGETSNLSINLSGIDPDLLSEVATNFTATVSYNSTLLAPIDKNMTVTTENTTSFIEIEGQLSGATQIATVPMKVGLGTAVSSGLVVTEFQLYDANGDSVDYEIEPGVSEFNILGICEEGGTRLVNPNGEQVEMTVAQGGLNTSATIYLDLIESGQTDLIIYDQLGNAVETAYSGTPSTGIKELNIDLSNFANGRYYIKLTTPTITKTEIIEILR